MVHLPVDKSIWMFINVTYSITRNSKIVYLITPRFAEQFPLVVSLQDTSLSTADSIYLILNAHISGMTVEAPAVIN